MDTARKGEVALLVLKHKLFRECVRLGPDLRRDVGNTAKAIGLPFEEAMEFVEELVREQVEELFAKKVDEQRPAEHATENRSRFDEEFERMSPEEKAAHERMGTRRVLEDLDKKYRKK